MKVWTAEEIRLKLLSEDEWVIRAFLAIYYSSQTREERDRGETIERNGRAFNKFDAPFFSRIIDEYSTNNFKNIPRNLFKVCRTKMLKYTKQLELLANRGA